MPRHRQSCSLTIRPLDFTQMKRGDKRSDRMSKGCKRYRQRALPPQAHSIALPLVGAHMGHTVAAAYVLGLTVTASMRSEITAATPAASSRLASSLSLTV